jgi:hypothetical protein
MTTTETPSRQTLTAMIHRHESERRDLADHLLAEQRDQADELLAAINPEVGAALAGAVADVERQIRQDRKADRLLAKIEPAVPGWAALAFPPLGSDEVDEGRKRMVLFAPPRFGDGHQEPVALALVDVSDQVFGVGSRARVNSETQNRERLTREQLARDLDERERDALRR